MSLASFIIDCFCRISRSKDLCQTTVLGLGLGVDFTFAWDNNNNDNNNKKNPHLNFLERNCTRC